MRSTFALAFVVALLPAIVPSAARAAVAVVARDPVAAPRFPGDSGLVADAIDLTFDCPTWAIRSIDSSPELSRADLDCTFEERVRVTNARATRVDAIGLYDGFHLADPVVVTVDGRDARAHLSREEAIAIDVAINTIGDGASSSSAADEHAIHFAFSMDAGAHAEIVVRGVVRLRASQRREEWERPESYGAWIPARVERHVFLGAAPKRWDAFIDVDLRPFRAFAGAPRGRVTVSAPSGWEIDARDRAPVRTSTSVDRTSSTFEYATTDFATVVLTSPPPPFFLATRGGPLLGLGASARLDEDTAPFHARLGWELALADSLFTSLSTDTDFRRHLVVTPLLEIASPGIFVLLPSFGFGLGLPVQIRPDARVGGRIQGDIHLGPLGAVVSLDLFPRQGSGTAFAQITGLGEISF